MPHWGGHKPVTRGALFKLLSNAQVRKTHFSQAQRAFATVCEFWAACQNHVLFEHLGDAVEARLSEAQLAFGIIGLPSAERVLAQARAQLSRHSEIPLERIIEGVQGELLAVDEPVDDTIELFAKRELSR